MFSCLAVSFALAYFAAVFVIYISHVAANGGTRADDVALSSNIKLVHLLLFVLLGPIVFVLGLAWQFGLAAESSGVSWRTGVILKTAISGMLVVLIGVTLFSRSLPNIKLEGLQLTSTLDLLTILLVPVTLLAPLGVLALYALAPQFYMAVARK
jgi:hypothetical protein